MPYKGIVFVLSDRWQVSLWKENVNVPKGTIKSRRKSVFTGNISITDNADIGFIPL